MTRVTTRSMQFIDIYVTLLYKVSFVVGLNLLFIVLLTFFSTHVWECLRFTWVDGFMMHMCWFMVCVCVCLQNPSSTNHWKLAWQIRFKVS